MRNINEFISNLTNDDIDLIDKLNNLYGHGQISEEDYEFALKKENFEIIEDFIREILQDDIGDTKLAKKYITFIMEETENLYEQGFCLKDDFTAGLYNCDNLYLYAIEDVLDTEID